MNVSLLNIDYILLISSVMLDNISNCMWRASIKLTKENPNCRLISPKIMVLRRFYTNQPSTIQHSYLLLMNNDESSKQSPNIVQINDNQYEYRSIIEINEATTLIITSTHVAVLVTERHRRLRALNPYFQLMLSQNIAMFSFLRRSNSPPK